jgi:hypothetical protein
VSRVSWAGECGVKISTSEYPTNQNQRISAATSDPRRDIQPSNSLYCSSLCLQVAYIRRVFLPKMHSKYRSFVVHLTSGIGNQTFASWKILKTVCSCREASAILARCQPRSPLPNT